jgi:hypothetical protein
VTQEVIGDAVTILCGLAEANILRPLVQIQSPQLLGLEGMEQPESFVAALSPVHAEDTTEDNG